MPCVQKGGDGTKQGSMREGRGNMRGGEHGACGSSCTLVAAKTYNPDPRWPIDGTHESPVSVTVSCMPPPCTSVSLLFETREFESVPKPAVGRITKNGNPLTCRPESSEVPGAVNCTVSGLVIW